MVYRSRFSDPLVDRLFDAILTLRDRGECYRFFEDLCTVEEVRAMAMRLHVAELLRAGLTYAEIAARTGMSSATISRVKRFLNYGADGYRLVLDRLGAGPARPTAVAPGRPPAARGRSRPAPAGSPPATPPSTPGSPRPR